MESPKHMNDVLMEEEENGGQANVMKGTQGEMPDGNGGAEHFMGGIKGVMRTQISYKSKLLGREEDTPVHEKDFDELMQEWLQEEREIAPELTEDQKLPLESLPKMHMPDERLKELCRPWREALIITLVGRNVSLQMMKDRLIWLLKTELFEIIDLPNNYFVFRSEDRNLADRLLFDGPWMIQGHYLAVQRWTPNFNPFCSNAHRVAIWVRVPTLPIHCYTEDFLMELGNMIGRALKVDMNTLAKHNNANMKVERGKFARVSVEVDLHKKLQSRFVLRNRVFTVEYEGLQVICFHCGQYGHNREACPVREKETEAGQNMNRNPTETGDDSGNTQNRRRQTLFSNPGIPATEEYGEWMKATRTFRQRPPQQQPDHGTKTKTSGDRKAKEKEQKTDLGTRYDILNDATHPANSEEIPRSFTNRGAVTEWRRKAVTDEGAKMGKNTRTKEAKRSGAAGERSDARDMEKHKADGGKGKDVMREVDIDGERENVDWALLFEFKGAHQEGSGPKQSKTGPRKRCLTNGPRVVSPIQKRKQANRAHNLVIGSISMMDQMVGERKQGDPWAEKGEADLSGPEEQRQEQMEFTEQTCAEEVMGKDLNAVPKEPPDRTNQKMESGSEPFFLLIYFS